MNWRSFAGLLLALAFQFTNRAATNLVFHSHPHAQFHFGGFVGERVQLTAENWLTPAPLANPGMLEMFALRDREPVPNLVPWAGEFVGKYLISAIQASRLGAKVSSLPETVSRLMEAQAEDGYLGPFPKKERLLGHWDLWGHYHCMLALLMWYEQSGDEHALQCVRRAADLVCKTYLDSGRRPIDAGSDEMNLSIIHAFGWLYRLTAEPRYLRMIQVIEKDWERGGDFVRTGLAGVEFFQTPRPRWEGLHSIQGLMELYRITGDEKYRRALIHHWRSIARWDLRNTGGFSSGEQATGDPYASSAIETCCSIAWMALSVDMLRLTGDSRVADLLELATLNAWAGAQHPSGRWCTYNTPMDGVREASAHTIVFQSRAGTPELNCCSVNGPRGWGMLSDWAVMQADDGYVINWLGPFTAMLPRINAPAQDGVRPAAAASTPRIAISGNYPVDPEVTIRVELEHEEEFALRVRIPEWSTNTVAHVNGDVVPRPKPGRYLTLKRKWSSQGRPDVLTLTLDMPLRAVAGARDTAGKVSVYRGPLLLAWDQRFNPYDESAVPLVDLRSFRNGGGPLSSRRAERSFPPLLLVNLPGNVTLCDFASAGALGTRYRSWLPATNVTPVGFVTRYPRDGAAVGPGEVAFRWTGAARTSGDVYTVQLSSSEDFSAPAYELPPGQAREALIQVNEKVPPGSYYWRVLARNSNGTTISTAPLARFVLDPSLPRTNETLVTRASSGPIVQTNLDHATLNGVNQRLVYEVGEWPEENYSVELRVKFTRFPTNRLGQVFSAWTAPSDDPLRITVEKGRLFARLEMGAGYSTDGVPIELGRWYKIAARKEGSRLRLVVDGQERASCSVPRFVSTRAHDFALGGNPHYSGNEFLEAEFAEITFGEPER